MRRVLPLLALFSVLAVLGVGIGTALTAETPSLPAAGVGAPATTTASQPDRAAPSKWTETDFGFGSAPKRS